VVCNQPDRAKSSASSGRHPPSLDAAIDTVERARSDISLAVVLFTSVRGILRVIKVCSPMIYSGFTRS